MVITLLMLYLLIALSGYCGWVTGGVIGYFTIGVAIAFFLTLMMEAAYTAGKKTGNTQTSEKEEDIHGVH